MLENKEKFIINRVEDVKDKVKGNSNPPDENEVVEKLERYY